MNGSNIIDNAMSKKSQVVQIDAKDTAFKTSSCKPWQLTPDAVPPASQPPLMGLAQLGANLISVNNGAQQFGESPLPLPYPSASTTAIPSAAPSPPPPPTPSPSPSPTTDADTGQVIEIPGFPPFTLPRLPPPAPAP